MTVSRKVILSLLLGAVLRLCIHYWLPGLGPWLDGRIEISTPITSYKRLHEGVFMYKNGVGPYVGNTVHQSPLLLALFAALDCDAVVVYTLVDTLAAYGVGVIASKISSNDNNWLFSAIYLFNPFSLMSSLALSTSVLANGLVVMAVALAVNGLAYTSIVLMVLAGSMTFYPLYLLIPLGPICMDYQPRLTWTKFSGFTLLTSLILGLLCQIVAQDSHWMAQTFGVILTFGELTPNIGLWWYFVIEMFDYFRPFFLGVFQIHLFIYVIPATIRLRQFPVFAFTVIWGLICLFKSYPEIGDYGLLYSLLPLFSFALPFLKYGFVSSLAIGHAIALGPVFHHLWIYLGSGNANFFYAITLVHSLGVTVLLTDFIWAVLRVEYDGGKDDNLVQL